MSGTTYPFVAFQSFPTSQDGPSSKLGYDAAGVVALPAVDAADTLTAAQLLRWAVVRKNVGLSANRALYLPTAADLVAAIPGALVGTSLQLCVLTGALTASGDVVVTAGTGGTAVGAMAVDQNAQGCFLVRLTNVTSGSEAYTVTRISA